MQVLSFVRFDVRVVDTDAAAADAADDGGAVVWRAKPEHLRMLRSDGPVVLFEVRRDDVSRVTRGWLSRPFAPSSVV